MLPQLEKLKGGVLDFVFPRFCVGCGREGDFFCPACRRQLPKIAPPICPKCGRPQPTGIVCASCAGWRAEIDGIRSPFRFEDTIRKAIHHLKYRNIRALAEPLAELLNDYLAENPLPGEALVPVPLHSKKLRERGYNQSGLLAAELGKLNGMPVVGDCLIRHRHVSPQARTANVEERRKNVAGAFICRDERLKSKQVLLIDDVSTSGATLDACAAALKASGAVTVRGLTVAREI